MKENLWDKAIDFNKFDGLDASNFLKELIKKYRDGLINIEQIKKLLKEHYEKHN